MRNEQREAEDLWRCLDIAAAENIEPTHFDTNTTLRGLRAALWRQLGPNGAAVTVLTNELLQDAAARMRTRLRALLTDVAGAV